MATTYWLRCHLLGSQVDGGRSDRLRLTGVFVHAGSMGVGCVWRCWGCVGWYMVDVVHVLGVSPAGGANQATGDMVAALVCTSVIHVWAAAGPGGCGATRGCSVPR